MVKDDRESFAREARRKRLRREQWPLSGKGLIDVAKTVGAMSGPIIATVQKILELLPE